VEKAVKIEPNCVVKSEKYNSRELRHGFRAISKRLPCRNFKLRLRPKPKEAQGQAELVQVVAQLAQSAEKLAQAAERFIEATLQKAQERHYETLDIPKPAGSETSTPDTLEGPSVADFTVPRADPGIFNPPEDE
jgi:hypothetical protein